jgi:hypothetical protein
MNRTPVVADVRHAWNQVVRQVHKHFRSCRLSTTEAAYAWLCGEYGATKLAGGTYGLEHVAFCLAAYDQWASNLPQKQKDKMELQLIAIRLALLYAWAKESRTESADWACAQIRLWAGTESSVLQRMVSGLILTVRAKKHPTVGEPQEQAITLIGLLGDELEHAKPMRQKK